MKSLLLERQVLLVDGPVVALSCVSALLGSTPSTASHITPPLALLQLLPRSGW